MVRRLAQGEWARFERASGGPRELQVLERRIQKLMAHIAALENALRTISNSKLYSNQQIQNLLRDLGLLNSDKFYEKKKEMLKIVLSSNLDLRKKAKELEDQGITLSSPKGNGQVQAAAS
jgi:septal ring factor EnvC (AmiA/AmiB activator)